MGDQEREEISLLRPGASEKKVDAAEQKMKLRFPADFRASLLCHDGQDIDDKKAKAHEDEEGGWVGFEWMPGCSPLAGLDAIVAQWEDEQERYEDDDAEVIEKGTLHSVMVQPRRIPIAGTRYWDGDNTYIDLFPGPKGVEGQLITFTSECDLAILGPSFAGAIELYLGALTSGDWVFDAKKGFVRPKNENADDFPHEGDEFASYVKKRAKGAAPVKPVKKGAKK